MPGFAVHRFSNVFTDWQNMPPIFKLNPVRVTNLSTDRRVSLTFVLRLVHHGGQNAALAQNTLRRMVTNWGESVLGQGMYQRGDAFTARAQTDPLAVDPESTKDVELHFTPFQGSEDVDEWFLAIESAELEITDHVSGRVHREPIPTATGA
jgi:hypothetical protein